MAVSDVEAVLEFMRKYGFSEAESALRQDMVEKTELGSFDFEKFFFPMEPPPPPLKIPSISRRSAHLPADDYSRSASPSSGEEFVSLGSSASDVCSSEFVNPYGIRSTSLGNSEASSDRLSQFGTARDYHDFEMQNDPSWYDEKDDGNFMTPCFEGPAFFGCPSEDKFIMTSERDEPLAIDKPSLFHVADDDEDQILAIDHYTADKDSEGPEALHCCSDPFCKLCGGTGAYYREKYANYRYHSSKETQSNDFQLKVVRDITSHCDSAPQNDYLDEKGSNVNWIEGFKGPSDLHFSDDEKMSSPKGRDSNDLANSKVTEEAHETGDDADGGDVASNELFDGSEEEYEVFDLRIIHRKNRTGFEENKDLPIVLNSIIAGRYYVTEYLGSAAFSKVVQAHDLHTGIDVCLKIIKNDKDFFDQSLDEIKLLKLVNKNDPLDKRHILRLYDYFYHQEHLFIVCELLRANLYEFQKFNQESGGECYFTLGRLQVITRQCLEALEYLHCLGLIHCDLKPENILIKSYKRCEIKVIDLGSSCFQSDNLCLYVQSRSYRAPEVILGLPYDQKIDMWSLGCILAELCSGEVLFPNDAVVMILARVVGMLGPIDLDMLQRGQETHKYFTAEYDLYHMNEETDQLEYIIPEESSLEHHLQVTDDGFLDFVRSLLEINPERRLTAEEALRHPWLHQSVV